MKFFKLVMRICVDPSVFKTLRGFPPIKAVVHLGLLALIFSFLIVVARFIPASGRIGRICESLANTFGEVVIDENGISPSVAPTEPRHLKLSSTAQLDYFPESKVDLKGLEEGAAKYGVIWSPQLLSFWGAVSPGKFFLFPLIYRGGLGRFSSRPFSFRDIKRFVESQSGKRGEFNIQTTFSISALSGVILAYYCALIFFSSMFVILSLSLFYALVSGAIFYFMSVDSAFAKNFKSLFVVAVYAGFPAILVASCFSAFQLPFLDYQTVFLIGFLVYFFIVINGVERENREKSQRNKT